MDKQTILRFIEQFKDGTEMFTCGLCYWFAFILQERFGGNMVALLIRWHMIPFAVEKSDNPGKTESKFKGLLGENIWKQVAVLNDCDRHAH